MIFGEFIEFYFYALIMPVHLGHVYGPSSNSPTTSSFLACTGKRPMGRPTCLKSGQ